ncbi:MAG: hypothetical protein NXH97_14755 [Rhodobacteraceae bacterium]|nr:hypothetical protein [Paracoccaceae bacterium]
MRWLGLILCLLWPLGASGQSRTVLPSELSLTATVEAMAHTPVTREMILITLRGIYRRHITLEKLVQPDLEGFSWTQLGLDSWHEERLDGERVKVFTRRIAVYPDRPGELTIAPFTHKLTLTDERDAWFEHEIQSEPLHITVAPAPETSDWWFPVRRLRVSDRWSNAPDQLAPGEGVLRIVQVEALGVTPEMIPPMPELTSPSAMIFPHPEKRLVELTPEGPMTIAFWRWTIQPTNDTSTIVEPMSFDYFDTTTRQSREVTISAQRVAYGTAVPETPSPQSSERAAPYSLPGWPAALLAGGVFAFGVGGSLWGRRLTGRSGLERFSIFDPLRRALRRSARRQDLAGVRQAAAAILRRDGGLDQKRAMLRDLDRSVFDPHGVPADLRGFVRNFLNTRPEQHGR